MAGSAGVVRFAFVVPLQDAGEATRSLEIARALRDHAPPDRRPEIVYVSHGGAFAELVRSEGFEVRDCDPVFHEHDWKAEVIRASADLVTSARRDLVVPHRELARPPPRRPRSPEESPAAPRV